MLHPLLIDFFSMRLALDFSKHFLESFNSLFWETDKRSFLWVIFQRQVGLFMSFIFCDIRIF